MAVRHHRIGIKMLNPTLVLTLSFSQPFVPWLSKFEALMSKDGYVLRTAWYEANSRGGGVFYTFSNKSGVGGDIRVTTGSSPNLVKPDQYEDWKKFEQGIFSPINLGIPAVKHSEIIYSNIGGGSLMAFVDRGTMRISELPHTVSGARGLKVVSKTPQEQTLSRFKKIAAVLGPELSEAGRAVDWSKMNVKLRFPK